MFGIQMSAPASEGLCCAAGTIVDAPVRKTRPASGLQIAVYLGHDAAGQSLRVVFPDGSSRSTGPLAEGFSSTLVAIPETLRSARGIVRIRVEAGHAPYILTSIYFE